MADTFTYSVGGNIGDVRMYIGDYDLTVTTGPRSGWTAMFTDEEIDRFVSAANSNVFRAAAIALRTIAAHRSLLAKRIAAGPYTEDMTAVARECRKTADAFDEQANQADIDAGGTEIIEEMQWTDFALDQILDNEDAAVG